MMPLVSIIVPAYNAAAYLDECLGSLCAQAYKRLEIIVVDDGSTDATAAVARRYADTDSRVKCVSVPNGGLSSARNIGTAMSTGEYVCYVDADDAMFDFSVSHMLDAAKAANADIVTGGMVRAAVMPRLRPSVSMPHMRVCTATDALVDSLYQRRGVLHAAWGKLYRRGIVEAVHFTEGLTYEDLDFFYRACGVAARIAVLQEPVYFYRDTPGSIMNVWHERRLDVLGIVDRIEEYASTQCPVALNAARDRKFSANYNMYLTARRNGRDDVASRCWGVIKHYRRGALADPSVRLKNKAGALLSYCGRHFIDIVARCLG